jgi:hypothetical protein
MSRVFYAAAGLVVLGGALLVAVFRPTARIARRGARLGADAETVANDVADPEEDDGKYPCDATSAVRSPHR